MSKTLKARLPLTLIVSLTACTPHVGSDAWCEDMLKKPKGDRTVSEATEFAKSCVIKTDKKND